MNNFQQAEKKGEDPVDKLSNHSGSYVRGTVMPAKLQSQAGNRSSYLSEREVFHTSVSKGPPPSFLIQTPLGTPHEENGGLNQKKEIPANWQHGGKQANPPSPAKKYEQAKTTPIKTKQKLDQSGGLVRLQKKVSKNGIVHRWVYEEVGLSMSKVSIMSMVLGLLFLGAMFFIIGFLAAVATLKSDEAARGSSQSAWQASNASGQRDQAHSAQGGGDGGKLGQMAGKLVGAEVSKKLQPLGKVMGATTAIVPAPLQPFARYGVGSVSAQVRRTGQAINPFAQRRGHQQPQQQYAGAQQQAPGMQQQYATQPYATPTGYPTASGVYQQQAVPFQGGQGGYYGQGYAPAPQQPIMMQQTSQQPMMQQQYYQQPMQQQPIQQQAMVPQQMMVPPQQQMPQQQMMQQPQYPQQMVSQQGYYR